MTIRTFLSLNTLAFALTTLAGCARQPVATPADSAAATDSTTATEAPAADEKDEVATAIAELPEVEQAAALAQKWCPVSAMNGGDNLLGSMGMPHKVIVDDKDVYLCCKGCVEEAQKDPAATLAKVDELTQKAAQH